MEQITDRLDRFMKIHNPTTETPKESIPLNTAPSLEADNKTSNQFMLPDVVDISAKGQALAQTEQQQQVSQSLARSLFSLATNEPDDTGEQKSTDPIDLAIEETQKKIRELKEQMERLKEKDDEASQEQLEELDKQMLALNAQLMALSQKKLELTKNA